MKLVPILKKLKAKREHQANVDAAAARAKYGYNLHRHPRFSYVTSGQTCWFSKPNEIARVFREVEGLPQVHIPFIHSISLPNFLLSGNRDHGDNLD
jgi:hypothetical protein